MNASVLRSELSFAPRDDLNFLPFADIVMSGGGACPYQSTQEDF